MCQITPTLIDLLLEWNVGNSMITPGAIVHPDGDDG
jgi:hypothetical protein